MFRGLQESRVGPAGAIILTALLWSVLHGIQYEPYWLFLIFLDGLILGVLRWRTNSLLPPILFHCLGNVVATVIFEINLRSGVY
jgi:membrane protease YdiL (CAAX protease family)